MDSGSRRGFFSFLLLFLLSLSSYKFPLGSKTPTSLVRKDLEKATLSHKLGSYTCCPKSKKNWAARPGPSRGFRWGHILLHPCICATLSETALLDAVGTQACSIFQTVPFPEQPGFCTSCLEPGPRAAWPSCRAPALSGPQSL